MRFARSPRPLPFGRNVSLTGTAPLPYGSSHLLKLGLTPSRRAALYALLLRLGKVAREYHRQPDDRRCPRHHQSKKKSLPRAHEWTSALSPWLEPSQQIRAK
jgi:hypothetical protein